MHPFCFRIRFCRFLTASFSILVCSRLLLPLLAQVPPSIQISNVQQDVSLSWSGGGFLQSSPSVNGPWTTETGAVSPHRMARSAVAQFFRIHSGFSLRVSKSGAGSGVVAAAGAGIDCGTDCLKTYAPGQRVVLKAAPAGGSAFGGWTGDCAGTTDCELILDRDRVVAAKFDPVTAADPIANGDFELGPGSGWLQEPGPVIYSASALGVQAHSGQFIARLGSEQDGRRLARMGQRFTLPKTQPLYVNFAAWVASEELCDVPWYDNISIYVNGVPVSVPERALLEVLSEVGIHQGVEEAKNILEGVRSLRPDVLALLLHHCQRVKAARLCIHWAEELQLPWASAARAAAAPHMTGSRWSARLKSRIRLSLCS